MKTLFNENWKFWKSPFGTDFDTAKTQLSQFEDVEIPHDWMIEDSDRLYEDGTGWYFNTFEAAQDKHYVFIFDGIYMDSIVYINGSPAGEWKSGYSQFILDVTDFVKDGTNEILVAARCQYPSARWYTGAGIYRNVWLCTYEDTFILENGIYVHTKKEGEGYRITIRAEITSLKNRPYSLVYKLISPDGYEAELLAEGESISDNSFSLNNTGSSPSSAVVEKIFYVNSPKEWSPSSPELYALQVELFTECDDSTSAHHDIIQSESLKLGFRDLRFDADKGLFINDSHIKLNGVCIHHDLGALGVAFNRCAMKRRLVQLKHMGVNALRLTHNVYDPAVLELADEMGFLVVSESMDMWERPKTEFDFARFFPDWYDKEVSSWVRRDRNHTCVFMWSIGNEIYDTHVDKRGLELTKILRDEVKKHDPLGNALVTSASNFMPWENARKCADELEVVGYNYAERCYKEHHEAHPDWIIYGSETYSIVQSRGIYHFPLSETILSDSDLQCSSLGNSSTSWGAESLEACICDDRDMEFSLGQFVWTGYDYIGEPTPYQTKNSYFGLIDTAGFCKDAYYVWKSAWTSCSDDPFVHIFPYWDYNEGQQVDVRVVSNAPYVELFLNGKSLGKQKLDHEPGSGRHIIADYSIIYEKGILRAVGLNENGEILAETEKRSFGDTHALKVDICATTSDDDLVFAEITAIDKEGNPVENACDYVKVSVKGGTLVGFDNGDSTDYDSYKSDTRRLFSGKVLAIVKKTDPGIIPQISAALTERRDVRAVRLSSPEGNAFGPDHRSTNIDVHVLPEGADKTDLTFRVLNRKGVDSNIAKVTWDGTTAILEALADGEFRLRCEAYNGAKEVKVISELWFNVSGIGTAYLGAYDYISGSLYSTGSDTITAGNEQGISMPRDSEAVVTFDGVDFGKDGSDEITVDIFGLTDDPLDFEIWDGIPGREDAVLLGKKIYHKKSIWNVYQPETWKLDHRLSGTKTISFKTYDKMHIRGFSFKKQGRAWYEIPAVSADSIYGDTFDKKADAVEGIGNNVTLTFGELDFGKAGANKVVIDGRANKSINTLHLIFRDPDSGTEEKEILEFSPGAEYTTERFTIANRTGTWEVSFVFLPGSNFDFKAFHFEA